MRAKRLKLRNEINDQITDSVTQISTPNTLSVEVEEKPEIVVIEPLAEEISSVQTIVPSPAKNALVDIKKSNKKK